MRLPDAQLRRVVGRDGLNGGETVPAGDLDLAHVTDIEHAGARPHRDVLLGNPRVLDRHVPARERDHLRARGAVASVKRRFLERCGGGLFHAAALGRGRNR